MRTLKAMVAASRPRAIQLSLKLTLKPPSPSLCRSSANQ